MQDAGEIGFTWWKVAIKHVNFHLKTKTIFLEILKEATNQITFQSNFYWKIVFMSSANKKKNI